MACVRRGGGRARRCLSGLDEPAGHTPPDPHRQIRAQQQSVIGEGPSVAQLAELGVQHTAIRGDAAMVVHVGELHSVGALLGPGVGDAAERCVLGLEDEFGHDNLPCVVLGALLVLGF